MGPNGMEEHKTCEKNSFNSRFPFNADDHAFIKAGDVLVLSWFCGHIYSKSTHILIRPQL